MPRRSTRGTGKASPDDEEAPDVEPREVSKSPSKDTPPKRNSKTTKTPTPSRTPTPAAGQQRKRKRTSAKGANQGVVEEDEPMDTSTNNEVTIENGMSQDKPGVKPNVINEKPTPTVKEKEKDDGERIRQQINQISEVLASDEDTSDDESPEVQRAQGINRKQQQKQQDDIIDGTQVPSTSANSRSGKVWTSTELKRLYDGITMYGTSNCAIDFIHFSALKTRTRDELYDKVNKIRQEIVVTREERIDEDIQKWEAIANGNEMEPTMSNKGVIGWLNVLNKVDRQHRCLDPVRTMKPLSEHFSMFKNTGTGSVKVTDLKSSRLVDQKSSLNWKRVYDFVAALMQNSTPLPGLNPLEASIVLSILDKIQNEAAEMDELKRIKIKGLLHNLQGNDLRNFEPDVPCNDRTSAQAYIDPLLLASRNKVLGDLPVLSQTFVDNFKCFPSSASPAHVVSRSPTVSDDLNQSVTPPPTVEVIASTP